MILFIYFLIFRHLVNRWKKVLEAVFVCCFTATVGFLLMLLQNDCKPLGLDPTKYPVQVCIKVILFLT